MRVFENPEFHRLFKEGKTSAQIGEAMGVKRATVDAWVTQAKKAGLIGDKLFQWTPERIETLRVMYTDGHMWDAIASAIGTSESAVKGAAFRFKFKRGQLGKLRPKDVELVTKMKAEGLSDLAVGRKLGCAESTVTDFRKKHGIGSPKMIVIDWTPQMDDRLRTLFKNGVAIREIAQKLGLLHGAVGRRIRKLKLSRPVPARPSFRKAADRSYDHLRDPAIRAKAAATRRQNMALKPVPKIKETVVAPQVIPLHARPWLSRKSGECVYPYGERGNIHSCCKPTFGGTNMCEGHASLCFSYEKRAA